MFRRADSFELQEGRPRRLLPQAEGKATAQRDHHADRPQADEASSQRAEPSRRRTGGGLQALQGAADEDFLDNHLITFHKEGAPSAPSTPLRILKQSL